MDINSPFQNNFVRTSAEWAVDDQVYADDCFLITSDVYYGSTNQRKFKLGDNIHRWSELDYCPIGSTPSGAGISRVVFTTNGSGEATVAALIGKTKGTDFDLFEYADGGAGTLYGIDLYTFNSGTGALTTLTPSTKYLVYYE